MRLDGVEVRRVDQVLRRPVGTAAGVHHHRPVVLVRVVCEVAEGWGEAGALAEGTAVDPSLDDVVDALTGPAVARLLASARSNGGDLPDAEVVVGGEVGPAERMAAAAIEMAVLDCGLRAAGRSLSDLLGTGGPVVAGAVVGIPADRRVASLQNAVDGEVAWGARRVRIKIEPGWDVEPVRAVRRAHPDLLLQVDANGAYRLGAEGEGRAERLAALDQFDLVCIEQPLVPDDLAAHALLAERIDTPICLDESLTTLERLHEAIGRGACEVACLKPPRLGGIWAAVRGQEICRAAGVPAFVGGFFETGLGRSANAALAGLEGFSLPGDLSDPAGYLVESPFTYPSPEDGLVRPPGGPGVAPPPDAAVLDRLTTDVRWFPATT